MKPIGQTFFVNEPATGVPGVFITKVDLFFETVSPTYGVELQIRTTENGVPTQQRLPFGQTVLHTDYYIYPTQTDYNNGLANTSITSLPALAPGGDTLYDDLTGFAIDTNTGANTRPAIMSSTDSTVATRFVFETPVFVESGKSYALVVIPIGGNPDYRIWAAEIGQNDVESGAAIYTNNDTGDLFLSSNDRDWSPVITEDFKFNIYIADFTISGGGGQAVFRSPNEDYVEISNYVGNFFQREPLYPSNGQSNISVLSVTGTNGTFSTGNYVYQTNGTVNTAVGIVYSANASVVKIQNTSAAFSNTQTLFNANSISNATVLTVSQNCVVSNTSNVVSLPDSSIFSVNDMIYIATSNLSRTQLVTVATITNSTAIQVNTNILFSDTNANYGKIAYNGALVGGLGGLLTYPDYTRLILDNVSSNTSMNFNNVVGNRLIGLTSGASGIINKVINIPYNAVGPQFTHISPANTDIFWGFKGIENNPTTYTPDPSFMPVNEGLTNEFIDYERILMARSNELTALPVGMLGSRSVEFSAQMGTSNNKISPSIDIMSKTPNFIYNRCFPSNFLTGYYLTLANVNGTFTNGDVIQQGSVTANSRFVNSSYIVVTDVPAGNVFVGNSSITDANTSATANVISATYFSETSDNGYWLASRYISKTVILATTQNSEDMIALLGAFRPSNTNLLVYTKVYNSQDPDRYDSKDWSRLIETTSVGLLSTNNDPNDQIELAFGFPASNNLFAANTVCNTTSNTVLLQSTFNINQGDKVYISDNTVNKFIVRTVTSIVNTTAVTLDTTPSFTSSNAAFGSIPGLESNYGAFLNDQNNFIVRYMNRNDLVFDSYSQFSIKIVPVASSTALVPRVGDMRVLAVQA